jgi:hypothetical protein
LYVTMTMAIRGGSSPSRPVDVVPPTVTRACA